MTIRRFCALLAFLALIAFFSVILVFVPRLDLAGAVLFGVALAGYDLWTQLRPQRRSR